MSPLSCEHALSIPLLLDLMPLSIRGYHWSAELLFGFWRVHSSLDPHVTAAGTTSLPRPSRVSFVRVDADDWPDYDGTNEWIARAALPGVSLEFADRWAERAQAGRAYTFARVILADRSAAMLHTNWSSTYRIAANTFTLPSSPHWWAPLRNAVVDFANVGVFPLADAHRPVITYFSRQDRAVGLHPGRLHRRLIEEDHQHLVHELHRLRDEKGYEVNIVIMNELSRIEQFQLAGRTTARLLCFGRLYVTHFGPDRDGCARPRPDVPTLDAT
jgi:hypothetical protein